MVLSMRAAANLILVLFYFGILENSKFNFIYVCQLLIFSIFFVIKLMKFGSILKEKKTDKTCYLLNCCSSQSVESTSHLSTLHVPSHYEQHMYMNQTTDEWRVVKKFVLSLGSITYTHT